MPCAQLPVAMTAPKTVKVTRPINSAYSMRAAPRRSRHRRRAITRTTYTLLPAARAQIVACSHASQGQHAGAMVRIRWMRFAGACYLDDLSVNVIHNRGGAALELHWATPVVHCDPGPAPDSTTPFRVIGLMASWVC